MQPCGVWKINPDQIYVVIFRKLRYNVYKVDIIPAHEAVSAAPQKAAAHPTAMSGGHGIMSTK